MPKNKFLYFLIFILISLNSLAEYVTVKDLKDDFLFFSKQKNSFLPLTRQNPPQKAVSILLSKQNKNHVLEINTSSPFTLFINGKILGNYQKNKSKFFSIQELMRLNTESNLMITIFTEATSNKLSARIVRPGNEVVIKQAIVKSLSDKFVPGLAKIREARNRYILGIAFSMIIFVILKITIPDIFSRVFRFYKSVETQGERNSLKLNYYQNESIFILTLSSILIALYIYVFTEEINVFKKLTILNSKSGTMVFITGFFISIMCFIFKIIINGIGASVFGVNNFAKILTNEFSKTVFQVLLILYPVYFIVLSPYYSLNMTYTTHIIYPIGLLIFIFVLKELYYFYKLFNFKKFHIIVYICICDLFPTCVLLKVLTQLEFV